MSNQSGISANEELLDVIHNSNDNGLLVIVAKISEDSSIVHFEQKYNSIEALHSSLADEPLYIFIKDPKKNADVYDFISFVPDNSPVRAKMLYASTKNTLLRQIGSNLISEQLLFTEQEEISDFMQNINQGPQKDALLTESEKAEKIISQEQRNMRTSQISYMGHRLVAQDNGASNTLTFNVSSEHGSIKSLLDQFNHVSFKVNLENEQVEVIEKLNINGVTDLQLISEHPSYTIFKNNQLYYFIYSCPSGSKVKERMIYASNKLGFIKHLKENEHIEFTNVLEIGDADELEISLISSGNDEEKKQNDEASAIDNKAQRFNRPKGPARRKRV